MNYFDGKEQGQGNKYYWDGWKSCEENFVDGNRHGQTISFY